MRTINNEEMSQEMSLEETMAILATLKLSKREQDEFLAILREYDLEAEFSPEGNVLSIESL